MLFYGHQLVLFIHHVAKQHFHESWYIPLIELESEAYYCKQLIASATINHPSDRSQLNLTCTFSKTPPRVGHHYYWGRYKQWNGLLEWNTGLSHFPVLDKFLNLFLEAYII